MRGDLSLEAIFLEFGFDSGVSSYPLSCMTIYPQYGMILLLSVCVLWFWPAWAAKHRGVAQLVEHRSPKPGVAGSSPVSPAKLSNR